MLYRTTQQTKFSSHPVELVMIIHPQSLFLLLSFIHNRRLLQSCKDGTGIGNCSRDQEKLRIQTDKYWLSFTQPTSYVACRRADIP